MNVTTMPCRMCGNRSVLHDVDALGYVRWKELGENIQDALPGLDADQRELLMTGTHAHCWERMWAGVDA
jgi:tRNA(Arg) A34 adenosine deaminase TadA